MSIRRGTKDGSKWDGLKVDYSRFNFDCVTLRRARSVPEGDCRVAVTSGASTPTLITKEVIGY
mgnify:FL=1